MCADAKLWRAERSQGAVGARVDAVVLPVVVLWQDVDCGVFE